VILSTKIAAANNGDNTLVAAPAANQVIRVLSFLLIAQGTVKAKFQSDNSGGAPVDLTGPLSLVAQTVVPSPAPVWTPGGLQGQFECAQGKQLNLNLSAGVEVDGWLTYQLIKV
jgi:hypothetical protein